MAARLNRPAPWSTPPAKGWERQKRFARRGARSVGTVRELDAAADVQAVLLERGKVVHVGVELVVVVVDGQAELDEAYKGWISVARKPSLDAAMIRWMRDANVDGSSRLKPDVSSDVS